jgi:RimJ/RimL family protein N-acetyltransferase
MYMPPSRTLSTASPLSGEAGEVLFETARLTCRRYTAADAPAIWQAANHEAIALNLRDRMPHPYTLEDAVDFVGRHEGVVENRYPTHVAVLVKPGAGGDAVYIGGLGIKPGDDVNYRTWEVGYWFAPEAWGKGYGSEAVGAFTRWLFAMFPQLNRLEASIFSRNTGSDRLLRKTGFTCEGVRRGMAEKNGVVEDETMFGLVRSDLDRV